MSSTHVIPRTYHSQQQHFSQYDFRCTYRVDSLLELYIWYFLRTALFWVIKRRVVEFLTGVSGQPIRLIFKGQESRRILTLSESSVRNYHYLLRNNLEERISHLTGGSLKSRFVFLILLFPLIHIRVTGTFNLVVNLYSVLILSEQEILTLQACFGHFYILNLNTSERYLMNFLKESSFKKWQNP